MEDRVLIARVLVSLSLMLAAVVTAWYYTDERPTGFFESILHAVRSLIIFALTTAILFIVMAALATAFLFAVTGDNPL